MSQKVPGIFPSQVTDAGYLNNPLGSNPFPYPSNMPAPLWNADPIMLAFAADAVGPVYATATWTSPVFDLRPEFRGVMDRAAGQAYLTAQAPSLGTNRAPIAASTVIQNSGCVPIWRPSGAAGKLWVQVANLNFRLWGTGLGFEVLATEFASINDPNDLQQIETVEDITTEFIGGKPSAIVQFLPPGAGYPVRYYRVSITFQYTVDGTFAGAAGWPDNRFRLYAAYY
jgi:hypothetical protein